MKTKLVLFFSLVILSSFAQTVDKEKDLRKQNADTTLGWKTGGVVNVTFAQSSFTNWAAGGQNSINVNGLVSLFANHLSANAAWDNNLDIGYGILKQGNDLSRTKFIKTDDKIELNSKYGYKASKSWYYAGLLNFKTQMTAGYNYPNDTDAISTLFAPAYTLAALGMDYKPKDNFNVFIAPVTSKFTVVNDTRLADAGAFGVEAATYDTAGVKLADGKKTRLELGGYLRMMYKKEIMKNITFLTKLDLFSNYLNNPGNIDVNWETLITMKVNKYISASLNTHLIYDHDINISLDKNNDGLVDAVGPRTQFKEIFGVAFSYKF